MKLRTKENRSPGLSAIRVVGLLAMFVSTSMAQESVAPRGGLASAPTTPATTATSTAAVASQPARDPRKTTGLSRQITELLQEAQRALDAKPPLAEAIAKEYGRARTLLIDAQSDLAKSQSLRSEAEGASEKLKSLKSQLEEKLPPLPEISPTRHSLVEIERRHAAAKSKLSELQQAKEFTDTRNRDLGRRITGLPEELSRAMQVLAEARKQRDQAPAEESLPGSAVAATALFHKAVVCRAKAVLRFLETERDHGATVTGVLRIEAQLIQRRMDHAGKEAEKLSEALATKRREQGLEMVRGAREMRQKFAERDPVLLELCEENVAIAEQASSPTGMIARLHKSQKRQAQIKAQLAQIQSDYEDVQARLRLTGMIEGVGTLLIEHKDRLPYLHRLEEWIDTSQKELNNVQLRRLQLREQDRNSRKDGPDMEGALARLRAEKDSGPWQADKRAVQSILESRRDLLGGGLKTCSKYLAALTETIAIEQQLLKTAEEMRDFIDEKVLWVPNMPALSLSDFQRAGQVLSRLDWRAIGADIAQDTREEFRSRPFHSCGMLLLALVLIACRPIIRRRIRYLGTQVLNHPPGTFTGTLEASFWTGLSGVAWPTLVWVIAFGLVATQPNTVTAMRVSQGFSWMAYFLLLLCLAGEFSQPLGLGEAHMRMSRVRLRAVRRLAVLIAFLTLPLLFIYTVTNARPTNLDRLALGRLANIASHLILALLAGVLLWPRGRLILGEGGQSSAGLLYRRWWLWYPLVVTLPIVISVAAAIGYDYSSVEISTRLSVMILMIVATWILNGITVRGLLLLRRQMLRQQVRKRQQIEAGEEGESDREFQTELLREAVEKVTSVSDQTTRAVRNFLGIVLLFGLYALWEDLLPAFRFLSQTNMYAVEGVPVTLADILKAILVGAIGASAIRTVPGMLDVYLLSRLKMEIGERSALTTITRHVLGIVGVLVICSYLGLTWSSMQWIVAALGVGLGFGLQEIVANLVVGLLMLFERRIRLGDIVTVGDATGRVTAIRTLATTITDWNNKELVVPNKDFLTARVTNWTFSEKTIRLEIAVGIAYGSDTRKAKDILVRVGRENEFTLDDPPVTAFFTAFGQSSLDFMLRVWLPNMDHWFPVRDELLQAIDDAFREANITIAFPQLDVHVDHPSTNSIPPGAAPHENTGD